MFGFSSGNSPIDRFRAHPVQGLFSILAGGLVPGGGMASGAMFNRWNQNQFNNAAQTGYDRSLQQTTMDANSAMDAPLNDPRLGGNTQFGYNGPTGPNNGSGGSLFDQLGQGAGSNGGGLFDSMPSGGSSGLFTPDYTMGPSAPPQGPQNADSIFVPQYGLAAQQVPNSPAPGGATPLGRQGILDFLSNNRNAWAGPPALYGVSPMQVGGAPVISGNSNVDLGQGVYANRRWW